MTDAPRILSRSTRAFIAIGVAVGAAVCLWLIAAYSIPFHPYTVHLYTVVPPTACPNVPVEVQVDSTVQHPWLGYANGYVIESSWVNVTSGQSIALPPYPGSFADNESGRNTGISPVLRIAPNMPGNWRLYSTITVKGRILLLPRDAIITYRSSDLFMALDADAKECAPS